ncbi:MAG: Fur family transcriptional regulator [Planctomycetota bacterium]|jgi:Fur family peroxide stress response transcriptional regulator
MSDSGRSDRESRSELKKRMDAFQAMCRQAGLKVTPQRMAVFKTLVEFNKHPSAEIVFQRVRESFPSISLDTVNRALLMLSDIGAAFVIEGSGSPKRFDANLQKHHHFKCVNCNKIIDIFHEPFDKIHVPESLKKNFIVSRKAVYLEGICNQCQ